jgi:hypothetical protein
VIEVEEPIRKNTQFVWTEQKTNVALGLAEGKSNRQVAKECELSEGTIRLWLQDPEFSEEVDRLTLMTDVATRAGRLRIAKRVIAERIKNQKVNTNKDLLDWLKFAQSETDGIKLDLTTLAEAAASMADSGSSGIPETPKSQIRDKTKS